MKSRKTFTLRLDEDMLSKLGFIAERNKRSINNQLECMVDRLICDYEKENGAIPLSGEE